MVGDVTWVSKVVFIRKNVKIQENTEGLGFDFDSRGDSSLLSNNFFIFMQTNCCELFILIEQYAKIRSLYNHLRKKDSLWHTAKFIRLTSIMKI